MTTYQQVDGQTFEFLATDTTSGNPVIGIADSITSFGDGVKLTNQPTGEKDDTTGTYTNKLTWPEVTNTDQLSITFTTTRPNTTIEPVALLSDDPNSLSTRKLYCQITDLYKRFGSENVNKWADLNNLLNVDEMTQNIIDAIENISNLIDAGFYRKLYTVPFATIPPSINEIATLKAGYELYNNRGTEDRTDPTMQASTQSADMLMKSILGGQILLDAPGPDRHPSIT